MILKEIYKTKLNFIKVKNTVNVLFKLFSLNLYNHKYFIYQYLAIFNKYLAKLY